MTNNTKEGNMFDPKEENQYDQLRRLGQKLHIPIPEHFITLEVFDKNGKLIQKHHQRSHSWTRNAYNLLLANMAGKNLDDTGVFGAGLLSIKDTAAAIKDESRGAGAGAYNADWDQSGKAYRCPGGSNIHGIQVGSGINAESFEDYVLQTLIDEGAAGGELNYVLSEVPTKAYGALTQTITHIRYMNNNSGGNVEVNEVGLVIQGFAGSISAVRWMMSRDHLASTVTVPDTGQLKVTYTIQLTYPS